MPKGAKKTGKGTENNAELLLADKIGHEAIERMRADVHEWTNSVQGRFNDLSSYVNTLESMNTRLEARTDRSLALAEVEEFYKLQLLIF